MGAGIHGSDRKICLSVNSYFSSILPGNRYIDRIINIPILQYQSQEIKSM